MKTIVTKLNFLVLLNLLAVSFFAQITSSTSSGRNSGKPDMAQQAETQTQKIIDDAGRYFKQGLFHLQDNRRSDAREDFDFAVEVFLVSGVDVQRNQTLRECYSQLIETVYRMEFPNNQIPQIRSLSGTCGWNIDPKLADEIAKLSQTSLEKPKPILEEKLKTPSVSKVEREVDKNGFIEQTFEASPLDELAKLEINQDRYTSGSVEKNKQDQLLLTGSKPLQMANGSVPVVLKYINDYFHDPYTVKYLGWSKISLRYYRNNPFWIVSLKLRAKNLYNAYRLSTLYFFIRKNKVSYSLEENEIDFNAISDLSTDSLTKNSTRSTFSVKGETWENISNRTGVSVAELKVANGNLPYPVGRVFVPMKTDSNNTSYSRPTKQNNVIIVKAQSGDTIETLAKRHGASPLEVAKFNGLYVTSKLSAGREIRIPTN